MTVVSMMNFPGGLQVKRGGEEMDEKEKCLAALGSILTGMRYNSAIGANFIAVSVSASKPNMFREQCEMALEKAIEMLGRKAKQGEGVSGWSLKRRLCFRFIILW